MLGRKLEVAERSTSIHIFADLFKKLKEATAVRARCWFVHALIGFSVHGSLTIKGKVMLKFWHGTPWVFDLFGYYRNFESKMGPKKEKSHKQLLVSLGIAYDHILGIKGFLLLFH